MRFSPLTIAALVAAGMLLARRSHHSYDDVDDLDEDTKSSLSTAVIFGALGALAAGAWVVSNQLRKGPADDPNVEESIELDVPVSTAYNQWTQFEEFPKFMATVESVRQIDDTHLHWVANVAGKVKEWDSEITEQIPDERIAWRSTSGPPNSGVVTFHKISENRCRVMLQMDYEPEGVIEQVGDAAGAVKLTTKGNLKKFKQLLESRGQETGAWRGTVAQT